MKLKAVVALYLDNNRDFVEELMYKGKYETVWVNIPGVPFEYRSIESYGGEGCGDNYWKLFEVRLPGETETALVRLNGWYSSYYGVDYSDYQFVTPRQKTITVYV